MNNNLDKYLKYKNKYKYLKQLIGGAKKNILLFGDEITDTKFKITDYTGSMYNEIIHLDATDDTIRRLKESETNLLKFNMIIFNNCDYGYIMRHIEYIISLLVLEKGSILYFTNLTQDIKNKIIKFVEGFKFIEFVPSQKSNTVILIDAILDNSYNRFNTGNNVISAVLHMGLSPNIRIYFFIDVYNDSGKIYISTTNNTGKTYKNYLGYTTKIIKTYEELTTNTISNIKHQIRITLNEKQFDVILDELKVIHIIPTNI